MNTQDERKAFEEWADAKCYYLDKGENGHYEKSSTALAWEIAQYFMAIGRGKVVELEGCVVVNKKDTEDWYLDPGEYMWFDRDGIDSTLCDMNIGEVTAIEHKEYLITVSDTIYAAKVWDSENEDVGFWEFFKTEAEAEKAATHCKAMVEAAKENNHE